MIKLLFLGDVVGDKGRECLKHLLPGLIREKGISYVVANGENAAGGSGITQKVATELYDSGVDAITMGDHLWKQKDVVHLLQNDPAFFRPFNYPPGTSGNGFGCVQKPGLPPLGVINIQGRTFMAPLENPFNMIESAVDCLRQQTSLILVDFHAEATSEKIAMGWLLDGKVSLVVGTHTHVQTADEKILPRGTGYLTDAGFCGPHLSVIGREIEPVIQGFKTMAPMRLPVADGWGKMQGVLVDVEISSGQVKRIERISRDLGSVVRHS